MVQHVPDADPVLTEGLVQALRNTGVSSFYQNEDLAVVWAQNIPLEWTSHNIVGLKDHDFLPREVADPLLSLKRSVLAAARNRRVEIRLPAGEQRRSDLWYDLWVDPAITGNGAVCGVFTTVIETTEQKRRENTLKALLREVSHRSRNLLAIIQSIATQTGRHSSSVEAFLARFRGRLQSLASSQDLVTSSNWRGADLADLALGQLRRYNDHPEAALRLTGESVWLNPNSALHVGLALHELITNSVSFGALSDPQGRAGLSATIETGAGREGFLALEWTEHVPRSAGTTGGTKHGKSFGSIALERIVPAAMDGSATLTIEGGILKYRLEVPPGNFENRWES